MIKIGEPPYLECSSRGDKRFSAFYDRVNGKSIEEQYQAFKIFTDGSTGKSWKEAKGKHPINYEAARDFYISLWKKYLDENPDLIEVIRKQSGLSDMFGQKGSVCQAEVIWNIVKVTQCNK